MSAHSTPPTTAAITTTTGTITPTITPTGTAAGGSHGYPAMSTRSGVDSTPRASTATTSNASANAAPHACPGAAVYVTTTPVGAIPPAAVALPCTAAGNCATVPARGAMERRRVKGGGVSTSATTTRTTTGACKARTCTGACELATCADGPTVGGSSTGSTTIENVSGVPPHTPTHVVSTALTLAVPAQSRVGANLSRVVLPTTAASGAFSDPNTRT